MPLQSTHLDDVLGIDIHIIKLPPPAAPPLVPMPIPFAGIVYDPMGLAVGAAISVVLSGSLGVVMVNGMPVTNCGTGVKGIVHFAIPPGTFAKSPGKNAHLYFGSLDVTLGGSYGVRDGDVALSCGDPTRLPSSVVMTGAKGAPVFNNASMAPDFKAMAMAAAFKAAGKVLKATGKALGWAARKFKDKFWKCRPPADAGRWRKLWHRGVRFITGDPVDVVTGNLFTDAVDAELPGPIPLVIERVYESAGSAKATSLGHGWNHSLDESFWLERGRAVVCLGDGREVEFPLWDLAERTLREGDSLYLANQRLTLRYHGAMRASVEHQDGTVHEFAPVSGGDPNIARLVKIRSRDGLHAIVLSYDVRGRLEWVRDTGGRLVGFEHDARGRLVALKMPLPHERGWYTHRRYLYDREGDLVEVQDSTGASYRYQYQGHLLVQRTDRAGLSFYFQYDGIGEISRCVRTWGDGGIYDHVITYNEGARRTTVEDSLGATTAYEYDVLNKVVAVHDAHGAVTRYDYDPATGVQVLEVDPLGGTTRKTVDARGNVLSVTDPCGAMTVMEYDEHDQLVAITNALGARWSAQYDGQGHLIGRTDPMGARVRYEWVNGLGVAITGPAGERTELSYDARKTLATVRNALGGETAFSHDERGRRIESRDPRGGVSRWQFDTEDRCVRAELPTGETVSWSFDGESNLLGHSDALGNVTRFRYGGFHVLIEQTDPEGGVVRYAYNTEGDLIGVVNELDEQYRIDLDRVGRVIREVGFDGRTQTFLYDKAGRCVEAINGAMRSKRLEHDPVGRVTRELRPGVSRDATPPPLEEVRYAYDASGALVYAKNGDAEVVFERDLLGCVIREQVNGHRVDSSYDTSGNRVARRTNQGHGALYHVDPLGLLRGVSVDVDPEWLTAAPDRDVTPAWRMTIARDSTGAEVERQLPGGVTAMWSYDVAGKPTAQRVVVGSERVLQRDYAWRGDEQIAAITDSRRGATAYFHDARSYLTAAQWPDGSVQYRAPDAVGNVYRTSDRGDRKYGKGGVLKEAEGVRYTHDADGQLVEKVLLDGQRWRYLWDGAGQLRELERPDGKVIQFAYDPLGRRVMKSFEGRTTEYVWDGDDLVHELRAEGTMTWVFEPETFAPLAKVEGRRRYGVLCDHLGASMEMRDEAGALAWRAQFDLYGATTDDVMRAHCPWRWPGQYEDEETGLYYNRFRYYDPEAGRYVSQDPIGLDGGLAQYGYVHDPLAWLDPLGLSGCRGGQKRPDIPTGNPDVGLDHIFSRHVPGFGGAQDDLFRIRPGMSQSQIARQLERAITTIWRKGTRVSNPSRDMQVFEKRMTINGLSARYRLVVDTVNNRIVTFFPALRS